MKLTRISVKTRKYRKAMRLPVTIIGFFLLICFLNKADAQPGNQSDWNVPPPLAPGTITRGDNDGRPSNGAAAALIFTDVSAALLPSAGFSVPELPPISAVAPQVSQPSQPVGDVLAALSDMPLPDAPDTPAMPDRTIQDAPEPPVTDIPLPAPPDLPAPPPEPAGSAIQNNGNTGVLPLMPAVDSPVLLTAPPAPQTFWTTPPVPQNIDIKPN